MAQLDMYVYVVVLLGFCQNSLSLLSGLGLLNSFCNEPNTPCLQKNQEELARALRPADAYVAKALVPSRVQGRRV